MQQTRGGGSRNRLWLCDPLISLVLAQALAQVTKFWGCSNLYQSQRDHQLSENKWSAAMFLPCLLYTHPPPHFPHAGAQKLFMLASCMLRTSSCWGYSHLAKHGKDLNPLHPTGMGKEPEQQRKSHPLSCHTIHVTSQPGLCYCFCPVLMWYLTFLLEVLQNLHNENAVTNIILHFPVNMKYCFFDKMLPPIFCSKQK